MTWSSVKANGLPTVGKKVLACTLRAVQSYPTDALVEVYVAEFGKDLAAGMQARSAAQGEHPSPILERLVAMGLSQKYERSPIVEAYRVEQRATGQHVGPDGWTSDLIRIEDYNVPTHYEYLTEPTLT